MALSNYLVKVGNSLDYSIPLNLIVEGTYKGTYSALDMDSNRVGTGELDRNVLDHAVAHCSMTIKAGSNKKISPLLQALKSRYVTGKEKEKKIWVSMWIAELDDYVSAYCYIPDMDFTTRRIDDKTDPWTMYYTEFTLEFIGY